MSSNLEDDKAVARLPLLLTLALLAGALAAVVMLLDALGVGGLPGNVWVGFGLAVGAVLATLAALASNSRASSMRSEAKRQSLANERNQEAILRLLDELSSLADGDLTVQATVTEDITGAIADSINYAIEALRGLVATMNASAISLDAAAKSTQAAAAHLAKASAGQSKQVSSATESVAEMAASIEEVSGNAERCADVARHSVDVAHKGGDAVRRTIDGMNAIRETIQETSMVFLNHLRPPLSLANMMSKRPSPSISAGTGSPYRPSKGVFWRVNASLSFL